MDVKGLLETLSVFHDDLVVVLRYQDKEGFWGDLDSYRGHYCELSVDTGEEPKSVIKVIQELKEAMGYTFSGYKGGDFIMHSYTDVYWAEYGNLGPLLSKVYYQNGNVIIVCEEEE